MAIFFRTMYWGAGVIALLVAILFIAGMLGFLRGQPPSDLGVKDAKLKPPAKTPNSVSSQAGLYPDHPQRAYADIAPLAFTGPATAAMDKLEKMARSTPGCEVIKREGLYLYAQCSTRWLRFTDDVELWADEAAQVVHVRSASRLGRKDFGVNRARVEAIRSAFKG